MNGIFWVLCSGAAWHDVLRRFGPWQTVYDRYRRGVETARFASAAMARGRHTGPSVASSND
ncbi:MAG: transposase [Chloroflexi bacterium]|nr:MAG: transposase [Chloroflexota bacterium]